jgi:hypothetical protein
MGKKQRSFSDKIAKGTGLRGKVCPVCEQVIRDIKVIRAARNEVKGSWRYVESIEKVCKCNEKEILG